MQTSNLKRVAVFGVIAVVLVVAVVAGLRWAKGRSDSYAQNNQSQNAPAEETPADDQNNAPGDPQVSTQPEHSSSSQPQQPSEQPQTAAEPNLAAAQPNPQSIPATGVVDILLPIASLAVLAFSFVRYMQARHRLLTLR